MAQVTLQLIEGLERGLMFRDLPTPVTIGREDDNTVRLNDERVSRFHAKIQEDGGQLILTDLDSTNGTRVNGHPVQMRVLQIGDQIAIGRCLLIFGSPEAINAKAEAILKDHKTASDAANHTNSGGELKDEGTPVGGPVLNEPLQHADDDMDIELFPDGPPAPPHGLRALHRAQVSDLLGYCHEQLRRVVLSASEEDGGIGVMRIGWQEWQRLLRLEMDLAVSMKKVSDPDA